MDRFRLALSLFFRRDDAESDDSSDAWERIGRELQGSVFALLALFLLVSLTSYIPIDSFNFFQGRLDYMNNLGGIVGALLGEWFLGTVGIVGYSVVGVAIWLSISAFRGASIRSHTMRLLGLTVAALLLSIACFLIFSDRVPEASLLQGGYVGKEAGTVLRKYLNTTGALLLVGGLFLVISILTMGLSIIRGFQSLIGEKEEPAAPEEEAKPTPAPVRAPVAAFKTTLPAATKKPKRSRKKKNEDGDADPAALEAGDATGEDAPSLEDEVATGESINPGEFSFQEMIPYTGKYAVPSLRLMKNLSSGARKMSRGELAENARMLCEHLLSFQITGEVVAISQGPVLTTYEFKPSAGIKLSKIANLQDDLGVVLGTRELRIVAPIPGKTVVGIEVPRPTSEVIALKETLSQKEFNDKKYRVPFALGKTTDGKCVFADMAAMPHLLVAGATGSGKSVFVNSLIMSFLFRMTPQQLRLILIDPKMLELSVFDGIPHLITNVITDNKIAFNALNWAVQEMERRYALMAKTNSKNIDTYNEKMKSASEKLPFIVIVVDELADLMLSGGQEVEVAITRLAQKARAAGIHLVIATQRPSTDVITGLIKANIPSRLSFKVPSGIDSRTVLDTSGAEELIGRGDSLMIQPGIPLRRLHGTFVTEEDLVRVVKNVKGGKDHSHLYIDMKS